MNTNSKVVSRTLAAVFSTCAAFIVVTLLTSSAVFAQSNAGRILGSVTDQSGAAVANATVASPTRRRA